MFWKEIYGRVVPLNEDATGVEVFRNFCVQQGIEHPAEDCPPISAEEVKNAIIGTRNFSAPGPDHINNFWFKKLASTHHHLARIFTSFLNGDQPVPAWLVEGRTVLLPKKGDLSDPKNYRPITCLNTCYKLLTSIMYRRILTSIERVWSEIREQS